jgi:hypothetical protein
LEASQGWALDEVWKERDSIGIAIKMWGAGRWARVHMETGVARIGRIKV